jgi:acetyltransferase-like isoleucine patch superfamily enzyme
MRFADWKFPDIEEGKPNQYNWVVQHIKNLNLGFRTDIGAFSYINAKQGVTIEDNVQIGSHCSLYSVSTIDNKQGPVHIKKNCRIGSHSVIMPGVTIGENSRIGAFSFVTEDIPENVIAYGIPARVIRTLTPEEINSEIDEDIE